MSSPGNLLYSCPIAQPRVPRKFLQNLSGKFSSSSEASLAVPREFRQNFFSKSPPEFRWYPSRGSPGILRESLQEFHKSFSCIYMRLPPRFFLGFFQNFLWLFLYICTGHSLGNFSNNCSGIPPGLPWEFFQ